MEPNDKVHADAAQFDIDDIEAAHTQVNNAAGAVGKQLGHAKIYNMDEGACKAPGGFLDSFYGLGASATLVCLRHIEQIIKNKYPNFQYQFP